MTIEELQQENRVLRAQLDLEREQFHTQNQHLREGERELEASRERYAELYDYAPVGYLRLSNSGWILDINIAGAQILGLPRQRLVKSPLIAQIAKPDRRKLLAHLSWCKRHRGKIITELRLHRRDGDKPAFAELTSTPHEEAGDRVGGFKSVITDITARKQAELALQESEKRFHNLADTAPVMIWISGPDKLCTYFNKPWLDFTGRTLEQELGDGWAQGVHPDDVKWCLKTYLRAFDARKSFEMEYRLGRHDGEYRWVLDQGLPLFTSTNEFKGYIGSCIDITGRKQMESALELAGSMPRENPAPVLRLLHGSRIGFANPAARQVLAHWGGALGDEAPRTIASIARRALARNKKLSRDLAVKNRTFQIWCVPVCRGGYVNIYFSDITRRRRAERELRRAHDQLATRVRRRTSELMRSVRVLRHQVAARKRTDQKLRESEERHRLMIEGAHDYAIFMLDSEGRVATWNHGAQEIKGYRPKEIIGRHFSCFYPREEVLNGEPDRLLEIARTTGRVEAEGWRVRKDGSQFWASVHIAALYDGKRQLRGFLKVSRDSTERRQAQEALRSNAEKLADFFDQAPFGLFWIGPRGKILRVNKAGLEMFGCAAERCLNRRVQEFHVDPEMVAPMLKRLARHEVVRSHHTRFRRADGNVRHVLIDANGLWEHSRFVLSRWYVRDITRQIELEREILSIAERERQRLGQDLHDDLCQQLTGIEFLSQTLTGELSHRSQDLAERAREITKMIRQAVNHTRELAHGLSPAELEVNGLIGALGELAGRTRNMFGIACRFQCRKFDLSLNPTVSIHLYRIAQEAVANAIKHGKASRVDIGLTQNQKRLVLGVKDNGLGMPTHPRKRKGMGLRVMQYRAGVIAGTLVFQRNAAGGNTVMCTVSDAFLQIKRKPSL